MFISTFFKNIFKSIKISISIIFSFIKIKIDMRQFFKQQFRNLRRLSPLLKELKNIRYYSKHNNKRNYEWFDCLIFTAIYLQF